MERNPDSGKNPTKFLAEGSYGCVFRPLLPCNEGNKKNKNKNRNLIGKIFSNNADYKSELQRNIHISSRVNTSNKFSPRFLGSCDIHTSKLSDKDMEEFNKCGFVAKRKTYLNQKEKEKDKGEHPSFIYPQLLMEYGGKPLSDLSTNFIDIFFTSKSLFEGIFLLQKHRMSHLDIKENNIVYDAEQDRMLLIDFGMMSQFKNLYKNAELDFNYAFYPPEFKFANFIMRKKALPYLEQLVENEILDPVGKGVDHYIDYNYIAFVKRYTMYISDEVRKLDNNPNGVKLNVAKFYAESRNKELFLFVSYFFKLYDELIMKHLAQSKTGSLTNKKKEVIMLTIFQDELAKKVDTYALGTVLIMRLGNDMKQNKTIIDKKNEELISSIISLLQKMTHANPFERYDATEAYGKYMEILRGKMNIKDMKI